MLKQIPLSSLEKSELNERLEEDPEDSEKFQELVGSIEALGDVNDPLLVRPVEGGGYEVIKGSRRLRAAKKAKGVEDIRCEVEDIDDSEALLRTITDNIDSFKKDITPRERALSLYELWEKRGTTEKPSPSELADILGVHRSTVTVWLEPLSDKWEDTIINPLSNNKQNVNGSRSIRNLSPRKLRSIRKTTEDEENAVRLAERTVEHDLTIRDLSDVRDLVEQGVSIENAVGVVTDELSMEEVEVDTQEEEETDSEPEPEPETTETTTSPETTDTPTTSNKSTESEAELANGSWGEPEEVTEDDENDETDTQQREPLISEEEKELAKETRGWADTLEEVEAATEEDGVVSIEFEVYGPMAEAVEEAMETGPFEDPEDLTEMALQKFLREGGWLK